LSEEVPDKHSVNYTEEKSLYIHGWVVHEFTLSTITSNHNLAQNNSCQKPGATDAAAERAIFSPMENELFQRKVKKLQVMLDEVHEQIAQVEQANEEIAAALKPSFPLRVIQGDGEQSALPRKPDLMIVYHLE
jgi:hypothetical protein